MWLVFYTMNKLNSSTILHLKIHYNFIGLLIQSIEIEWFFWIFHYGLLIQCRLSMIRGWLVLGNSLIFFGRAMILGKCMAKVLMWVISTGRRRMMPVAVPCNFSSYSTLCWVLSTELLYYTYNLTDLSFLLMELKNQEWLLSAKNRSKPGLEAALWPLKFCNWKHFTLQSQSTRFVISK